MHISKIISFSGLLREIPPAGVKRSRKKALQHSHGFSILSVLVSSIVFWQLLALRLQTVSSGHQDWKQNVYWSDFLHSAKHHPSVNVIVLCLGLVALVAEHFIQYIDS